MIGGPAPDHVAAAKILADLERERAAFLALHSRVAAAHPDWVSKNDARTNLLAKPINHVLMAIVNVQIVQRVLVYVDFWRTNVSPDLNTPELIGPPYFEQNTFYRFGFFLFLLSNIEHGFRAIQPKVVRGIDEHSDQPFAQVYSTLFRAVLTPALAAEHGNTFDLLRTLRNTVHNNGVFSPNIRKDAEFTVAGTKYSFVVGKRADYFGWEHFIGWLPPIRSALTDVTDAPLVASVQHISDVASHP